jgi:hypothetical protein
MADKMLDRLSKILNQAERAEEGSPEREAFMEKAMALASAHSIDLSIARAHQAKKERTEEPESRRFKIGSYYHERVITYDEPVNGQEDYVFGDRLTQHSSWLVTLFATICETQDLKCTFSTNGIYVWAHGFPSDMDVAEKLYAILSVQMMRDADAAIKRGEHKNLNEPRYVTRSVPNPDYDPDDETYRATEEEDGWSGWHNPKTITREVLVTKVDGREYRANFYKGYIRRVGARLWEARREAQKAAGVQEEGSTAALAIRDKKAEVEDHYEKRVLSTVSKRGGWSPAQASSYIDAGVESGQEAGARANMGLTPDVEPSRKVSID